MIQKTIRQFSERKILNMNLLLWFRKSPKYRLPGDERLFWKNTSI